MGVMKKEDPTIAGINVKRLRLAVGISTQELADIAGVCRQTVTGLENGYTNQADPRISTLTRLATALGVELVDLLVQKRARGRVVR